MWSSQRISVENRDSIPWSCAHGLRTLAANVEQNTNSQRMRRHIHEKPLCTMRQRETAILCGRRLQSVPPLAMTFNVDEYFLLFYFWTRTCANLTHLNFATFFLINLRNFLLELCRTLKLIYAKIYCISKRNITSVFTKNKWYMDN